MSRRLLGSSDETHWPPPFDKKPNRSVALTAVGLGALNTKPPRSIPELVRAKYPVQWCLPGRKRPFATSTVATNNLIEALDEDGYTIAQTYQRIHYDPEASAILAFLMAHGYGDRRLSEFPWGNVSDKEQR